MFCLREETGLQSEDVAVSYIHGEAAEGWWEKRGDRATPLCKQLTLVVVEGWGSGLVSMFPWHAALAQGAGGSWTD